MEGPNQTTKSLLFFSNFCSHSKNILEKLNKGGLNQKFDYICIDKRFVKNNITYIYNPDGSSFPLPPMINRVPVLLLKPNHELLAGNQILEYIQPQSKTIQEENNKINMEPNAFAFEGDSCYGVSSDNFSFLDTSVDDLGAKGNGGMRQMYHYSTLDQTPQSINTPQEGDKQNKLSMSMEQLQQQRNSEIK
jgi:hypothetical protein